jgi:uncharacterized membrane protein
LIIELKYPVEFFDRQRATYLLSLDFITILFLSSRILQGQTVQNHLIYLNHLSTALDSLESGILVVYSFCR